MFEAFAASDVSRDVDQLVQHATSLSCAGQPFPASRLCSKKSGSLRRGARRRRGVQHAGRSCRASFVMAIGPLARCSISQQIDVLRHAPSYRA
ncbi:hypothetical protein K788_0005726 [Paraburkholderia caribensis MBA4]|uniref:Uncharacterized protein n=1 Tax=Paraburkholderia caribensis MBA4 TaxID=1323664 RepID=A0A0P0RDE4_9BURK|nr:hypothetical protein K788_0005726 [Paraburkholderia caribensis MBA4]